jgi:hypothetical protein
LADQILDAAAQRAMIDAFAAADRERGGVEAQTRFAATAQNLRNVYAAYAPCPAAVSGFGCGSSCHSETAT